MKNVIITFALLLGFATFSFAQFSHQLDPKVARNIRIQPAVKIPPKFVYQPNCPDLAAYGLTVSKVSGGAYSGTIKISASVKNMGKQHFIANPNQASAALYEVYPGGRKILLARISLTRVNAGQTIALGDRYRSWNTSNEFPPSYQLVIGYDPDITLDGNPRNDDCVRPNNKKEIDGYQIHRIFRAGR
jgi:hypothetical protein